MAVGVSLGPSRPAAGEEPWFIPADHWACLAPLDGVDCSGGGADGMLADWTAPRDIRTENPVVGTEWDDIDFGGAARSAGYLGSGAPTFVQWSAVDEPGVVDFQEATESRGDPTTDVLAIAVTYVENTTAEPLRVDVCVASDDSIQVWLGSELVLNRSVCRALAGVCDDTSTTILAPGIHRVAVLVWQGIGGHAFRLALLRADGSPLGEDDPEIRYLPAQGPVLPSPQLPFLTRSWAGAEEEIAGSSHRVTLAATGSFASGRHYDVCELLRGPITPRDVTSLSPSTTVLPWEDPTPSVGLFHEGVVGVPCSPDNATSYGGDVYTTRATTGGDIWLNGDVFEFAYARVRGDFDIAAEIVAKRFPPVGRWGKFGLMARQALSADSRFGHIQDHGPDLRDAARYARRVVHGDALTTEEVATTAGLYDPNNRRSLAHPRFLRLTRRGNVLAGWVSESAGLRGYDPRDDRNWVQVHDDAWGDMPETVYLGFAYSVHGETSGCETGEVDWRLLAFDRTQEPWPPVGVQICWNVPGARLSGEGLRYTVSGPRGESAEVFGFVDGAATRGPRLLRFQSRGDETTGLLSQLRDIGDQGPCSPGSLELDDRGTDSTGDDEYSLEASGRDIWLGGDQFAFAFREVTGDFSLSARISEVDGPDQGGRWGKLGLMARWDASPTAAYYFVHDSAATNMRCDVDGPRTAIRPRRDPAGGGNREPFAIWWQDVFGEEPLATECQPLVTDPRLNDLRGDRRNLAPFLRLIRRGSSFFAYGSDDEESWVSLGACGWPHVPPTLLVGVAATSHADCERVELEVDRLTLEPPSPILWTVDDPTAAKARRVVEERFNDRNRQCPNGWSCTRGGSGTFLPQIVNQRLRLADMRDSALGNGGDTASMVLLGRTVELGQPLLAEFDAYFSYDPTLSGNGTPPGDGLTFCMLGTTTGAEDLDLRAGDAGSGLGFARIGLSLDESRLRSRAIARNGFAVELDVWHSDGIPNEGDGANVSGGWESTVPPLTRRLPYHVAVNAASTVDSIQRNHQLGVRDEDLPNLFAPEGVHVQILYEGGRVRAWIRPGDSSPQADRLVLDAEVEPLEVNAEEAIVGFTAGTGSASCIIEVDDFALDELEPAISVFHRGDANDSGSIDISDAIYVLNYLFLGGGSPACLEAANANDDPGIDITDGIYLLGFLFLGGAPPPAPGPPGFPCGPDPPGSPSQLGCASYASCP